MRRIITNAIITPPDGGIIVVGPRRPLLDVLDSARRFAAAADASYVGHATTAELLGVPVFRGEYTPRRGDLVLVVTAAWRPSPGAELPASALDARVAYYPGAAACPCGDQGCLADYVSCPPDDPDPIAVRDGDPGLVLELAALTGARIGCRYAR